MRNIDELKNAFGKADDQFENNVYKTLSALEKTGDKEVKRVKFKGILVFSAACILLVSTTVLALTNHWGIFDFIRNRSSNTEVLPEADDLVQNPVIQSENNETDIVSLNVREAVFDGQGIYIVVAVKPSSEEYLLLGIGEIPEDPLQNMGPIFEGRTETIREYADSCGKKIISAPLSNRLAETGLPVMATIDYVLEEDGTLVYMLKGIYTGNEDTLNIDLSCTVAPFITQDGEDEIDSDHMKENTMSLTLNSSEAYDAVTSTEPAEYSDCGVRVDKVTLKSSPMAIYTEIEYTVIDQEKYEKTEGGLWFEFIDENGDRLPGGADNSGSVEQADESGIQFIQKTSIQAESEFPDKMTLRGYNCWDKVKYETHTFNMN